jgi:hypothetical protein
MERVVIDITNDVTRTYIVAQTGQQELYRILVALAYVQPNIGYCQGLNFVAGVLHLVMQSEERAFWVLLGMIHRQHMDTLYMQGVPDLPLREHQMQHFMKTYLPSLHQHCRSADINSQLFLSKWIMTVYASYLPLTTLLHVWDCFIVQGWEAVFKVGIAILKELAPELMEADLDKVSDFIRASQRNRHFDAQQLLGEAALVPITSLDVSKVEEAYFIEQARAKLGQSSETDDVAIRDAKDQLHRLDEPSRKYVAAFQEKIEQVSKELDALNPYYQDACMDLQGLELNIDQLSELKCSYTLSLKTARPTRKQSEAVYKQLLPIKSPSRLPVVTVLVQQPQPSASKPCVRDEDISLTRHKLAGIDEELKGLQKQHSAKYAVYCEAKTRIDEMKERKTKYIDQLSGFLEMLQVKQTETLGKLSSEIKPRRT